MRITLALDLEGTLISNALPMDCTARPGLWSFLSMARRQFRIVLYTNVFPRRARASLRRIVRQGHAPAWLARVPIFNPPCPSGEQEAKDLRLVGPLGRVFIVDDSPGSIRQDQRPFWLPIKSFWGEGADNELERISNALMQMFMDIVEGMRFEPWTLDAQKILDAGRQIYYGNDDLGEHEVIKEYPDGKKELVTFDFQTGKEIFLKHYESL
ncbi:NIF family HAD-type phosphatase [Fundidesulfovibrio terrae]|uniref:NIF family HAD-type phosphatase n=1 Tax=Fundidesulfovibrio terrae TaxID=2922866 RepID=UPI001FAF3247|nr:NIF family HAD-type phosphatase [Fundidesulfovibrio terrae]